MSSSSQDSAQAAVYLRPSLLLCLLVLLSSIFFSASALADSLRITLIPSRDTPSYQRVIAAIDQQLLTQAANDMTITVVALDEFNRRSHQIDQASDLLVPIGILATDSVIRQNGTSPILATLVPRISFNASLKKSQTDTATTKQRHISAVLLDQPIERQLTLAQLLFGNRQRIGIPLGPQSQILADEIKQASDTLDLSVEIEIIDDSDLLMPKLSTLLDHSDVLLALPDPGLFNRRTVRNILLSTYRKRIPVIGFSHAYVKAGALAAAYSTPRQIGKQTGEILLSLSHKPASTFNGLHPPKYFSVAINAQVSRSLGVRKISAQKLEQQILQHEHEHQ